eukprot:TRINITY_DN21717_c0_g1_i3.p1 TRINITY_DN21717_c0_g1~~TRINITY_DN21717_c0_g1_i3.p1  ORF type:complete len:289 (+),score=51.04 TRINITY_DN21717_c0_g1_i3:248-1114(+)
MKTKEKKVKTPEERAKAEAEFIAKFVTGYAPTDGQRAELMRYLINDHPRFTKANSTSFCCMGGNREISALELAVGGHRGRAVLEVFLDDSIGGKKYKAFEHWRLVCEKLGDETVKRPAKAKSKYSKKKGKAKAKAKAVLTSAQAEDGAKAASPQSGEAGAEAAPMDEEKKREQAATSSAGAQATLKPNKELDSWLCLEDRVWAVGRVKTKAEEVFGAAWKDKKDPAFALCRHFESHLGCKTDRPEGYRKRAWEKQVCLGEWDQFAMGLGGGPPLPPMMPGGGGGCPMQ